MQYKRLYKPTLPAAGAHDGIESSLQRSAWTVEKRESFSRLQTIIMQRIDELLSRADPLTSAF